MAREIERWENEGGSCEECLPVNDTCNAREISDALKRYLNWNRRLVVATNIFVLGSPFEEDLITVSSAMYYSVYEVKISRADYFSDFKKRTHKYGKGGELKHDFYSGDTPCKRWGGDVPKPARFYFVTPKGLLNKSEIPAKYGLLEYDETATIRYKQFKVVTPAKRLKQPTKLSTKQLYNIATKLS